jgi:4-hydroxy-3-polyprenylbenzoate decarboxylase
MGIDATVPYGYESDFLRPVYPVDQVFPESFFTPEQVAKAKSYMTNKGWVHSLARTGR